MQEDPSLPVLLKISADLATNTEATKGIERHLRELNGKVATQESFTRTLHETVQLHTRVLDGIDKNSERSSANRARIAWLTVENIFKLAFAIAIAYLLYQAGLQ